MSLAINIDDVTAVLVAGEWHEITDESFDLDSYEFMEGRDEHERVLHGGGNAGVTSTGFRFTGKDGRTMCGPITAIQAVKTGAKRKPPAPMVVR